MTRRMLAFLTAAPLAIAKRGPKRDGVWDTPQGRYCLRLRAELERLGHFDDLREDWEAVELALAEGCLYFEVGLSRVGNGKYWYRVVPSTFNPVPGARQKYVIVEILKWGEL